MAGWGRLAKGVVLAGLAAAAAGQTANATPGLLGEPQEQGLLCRAAIRQAEAGRALPPLLLSAIARVESGRSDPVTHRVHPWPWSINVDGRGYVFGSKAEAVSYARSLQTSGVRSFDVGCLQVNLMYHPDAFRDLDEAFEPTANARYAASFLTSLKDSTGSWQQASAAYHSATPELGRAYRAQVEAALTEEAKTDGSFALAGVGTPPMAGPSALRSLPPGFGNFMMPNGHFAGGMVPAPRIIGNNFAANTGPGGAIMGRGLDDYRARPVAMLSARSWLR